MFMNLYLHASPRRLAVRQGLFRSLQTRTYSLGTSQPTKWSRWSARIWLRPRFLVRGVIISSLLWGLLYETWSARKEFENLRLQFRFLDTLAKIQRVDCGEYANVDFSSYQASSDYFAHLWTAANFPGSPSPESILQHKNFHDDPDRRDQARTIMREAAENIHAHFAGSKDDPNLAVMGMLVHSELMMAIAKLVELVIAHAIITLQGLPAKEVEAERVG
ncbi:hypothetical protein C8R45DRAFT_1003978 [Mycena sanguinolenta]|nr:hypothetical protein C8R45DRAFT_1003978 [Mycena sanguinolenta]